MNVRLEPKAGTFIIQEDRGKAVAKAIPGAASRPRRDGPERLDLIGMPEADDALLALLGEQVVVLHSPSIGGGGDVDCAVRSPDPGWFRRLQDDERVVQCLRYDITGRYWVVDLGGSFVKVDTLADEAGLGRYGFPTSILFDDPVDPALGPRPFQVAAYLTAKRLVKGIVESAEWRRIASLAADEPSRYTQTLQQLLGPHSGSEIAGMVLSKEAPSTVAARRARRSLKIRRLRTPRRAATIGAKKVGRLIGRIFRPTGMVLLIAGPDGTGKSTLAETLAVTLAPAFRRIQRYHWKASILPRPGRVAGQPQGDHARPHERRPHSRPVSYGLLAYHFLDALLASWLKVIPAKMRSTLIIVERGWWDIAVDPLRYRLDVSPKLCRLLGALLPGPDLAVLLTGSPDSIVARKDELSTDELERQMRAWPATLPDRTASVTLDPGESPSQVARMARDSACAYLSERLHRRHGDWMRIPRRDVWIPTSRRGSKAALNFLNPMTARSSAARRGMSMLLSAGAGRLVSGSAPPGEVRLALAPFLQAGESYCALRGNGNGRFVAGLISGTGEIRAVAKVRAVHQDAEREAHAIERLARLLPPLVRAPQVIDLRDGVLLLEPISARHRSRPSGLPLEVAEALGTFWSKEGDALSGPTHGDLAPWNLLATEDGWVLLDWEQARVDGAPFFDLFHFWVQSHALLGRPRRDELMEAFEGQGNLAPVLQSYAAAAGLDVSAAFDHFVEYLASSAELMDPNRPDLDVVERVRRDFLAGSV